MSDDPALNIADWHPPGTIVIPIVAGIGNALMAEPMVRQLHAARPDLHMVVNAMIDPMGEPFRRIGRVIVNVTGKGLKKMLATTLATRRMRTKAYVVPFPSNRWEYNLLAAASGSENVVMHGYPVRAFGARLSGANRVVAERGIHDVAQNLRLLQAMHLAPDFTMAPRFLVSETERAGAITLLDRAKVDRPFVVVHAGSARTILAAAKRWPTEKYAELVQAIVRETGHSVVIVEGPDEAGVSETILSHCTDKARLHSIPLKGRLGDSAAVLEQAAFYCGTDSGLAHLSAAVGKRAITLFGPADPERVCPFGNRDLVIQPPGIERVPFLYPWEATKPKLRAQDVDLIKRITVEQVMEKVRLLRSAP